MGEDEGLVPTQRIDDIALRSAATLWAETTTDGSSDRSRDLRRDKTLAVLSFFGFVAKHPAQIMPGDVRRWRDELESRGLRQNTVYAKVSRLSSFYRWLMKDPVLGPYIIYEAGCCVKQYFRHTSPLRHEAALSLQRVLTYRA